MAETDLPRARGTYCSAPNCKSYRSKTGKLSYFRFPKNPDRCVKWVENTRRQDLLKRSPAELHGRRLCATHFEDSQFMNDKRNKLVWNAVPTLFDVPNPPPLLAIKRKPPPPPPPPPTISLFRAPECSVIVKLEPPEPGVPIAVPNEPTPEQKLQEKLKACQKRNQNLRSRLCRLNKKLKRPKAVSKKQLLACLPKYLSGLSLEFVQTQLLLAGKDSTRGHRYSEDFKAFCLSLFESSHKCYKLLRNSFVLPSLKTIHYKNLGLQPDGKAGSLPESMVTDSEDSPTSDGLPERSLSEYMLTVSEDSTALHSSNGLPGSVLRNCPEPGSSNSLPGDSLLESGSTVSQKSAALDSSKSSPGCALPKSVPTTVSEKNPVLDPSNSLWTDVDTLLW